MPSESEVIMSFKEERIHKSTVLANYAREGFLRGAKVAAKKIKDSDSVEEIKSILDNLLLDHQAVDEAEKDLAYWKEHFEGKEVENDGQN